MTTAAAEYLLNNKICPLPFMMLNITSNGVVYPCDCGYYLKDKYEVGNIADSTMKEIWNNNKITKFRKLIYEGKYQEICSPYCPRYIKLLRKEFIPIINYVGDDLLAEIKQQKEVLQTPMTAINAQGDSSCNLACIMCRKERRTEPSDLEKHITTKVFDELVESSHNLRWMRISVNGEFFFKKSTLDLLDKLRTKDLGNISMHIVTNGTLLDESRWGLLENLKLKELHVSVSVDASTEETYAAIRKYGNWPKLNKNLEMLAEKRAAGMLDSFFVSFVVMKSNVADMLHFIDLGKKWKCDDIRFKKIYYGTEDTGENFFEIIEKAQTKNITHVIKAIRLFLSLQKTLNDPRIQDPQVNITTLRSYRDVSVGKLLKTYMKALSARWGKNP